MLLFVLFYITVPVATGIQCYTCASLEYDHLYKKFQSFRHSMKRPLFGTFCDNINELKRLAPTLRCRSTCVTLVEPQYFGGIQAQDTPFLYIRGCADAVFSAAKESSREIDLLRSEPGCIDLRWSQIWPSIQADELVKVCSCRSDGCNIVISGAIFSSQTTKLAYFPVIVILCLLAELLRQ